MPQQGLARECVVLGQGVAEVGGAPGAQRVHIPVLLAPDLAVHNREVAQLAILRAWHVVDQVGDHGTLWTKLVDHGMLWTKLRACCGPSW